MANKRHWTEEEKKFLIENYKKYYVDDLAKRLNRSSMSVYKEASILGIVDKHKCFSNWTFDEISIIKNNYQKIGLKQVCKLLNRTQPAIQAKAKQLGVQPKKTPTTSKKIRAGKLKSKYGMTLDEYDKLFEAQNGVCAICGKPEIWKHQGGAVCRLAVDHSHKSGKVRGLLCHHCNLLLGNAKDSIQILKSATKYLKKKEGD